MGILRMVWFLFIGVLVFVRYTGQVALTATNYIFNVKIYLKYKQFVKRFTRLSLRPPASNIKLNKSKLKYT